MKINMTDSPVCKIPGRVRLPLSTGEPSAWGEGAVQ